MSNTKRKTDETGSAAAARRPRKDARPGPPQDDLSAPPAGQPVPYGYGAYYGTPPYYGGAVPHAPADGLSFARLLRVASKKRITVAAAVAYALLATAFYLLLAPKIYRASSLIEMTVRQPRILGQQAAVISDDSPYQSEEIFNTRLEKFKGSTMHGLATAKLRAMYDAGLLGARDKPPALSGSATFALLRRSRLVRITAENRDPRLAAAVANAYAEAAEAGAIEQNRADSDSAVAWLQAQAAAQRGALQEADHALLSFRSENRIEVLENQRKSVAESLIQFSAALTECERQAVLLADLLQTLEALNPTIENVSRLPASSPRLEAIRELAEKWSAATAERAARLTRFTREHPEVVSLEAAVAKLQEQVRDQIRGATQTVAADLSLARQQAESLRGKIVTQSKLASEMELQTVEWKSRLSALERERDACDVAYRGILSRIEEARLSADENTATVKIVERAGVPASPAKPRRLRLVLLAVFAGLAGGLALALVTDTLEDCVANAADIEAGVGLRILGLVPRAATTDRRALATAALQKESSQFTEAFAAIRGILDSPQYRDSARALLVVSTGAEEGKSIVACNLAIALAKSGKRTLLVDFDLRRPRLGRIFEVPDSAPSLIDALGADGPETFEHLPLPAGGEHLEVVISRSAPDLNPADRVASPAVPRFLEWAQQRYDRVVIDSPPFGIVGDALVFAGYATGVLIVCRPGYSRKRAMRYAVRHLTEAGATVIGAIVNDVEFHKGAYFANYDYYQTHYNYAFNYPPKNPSAQPPDRPGA